MLANIAYIELYYVVARSLYILVVKYAAGLTAGALRRAALRREGRRDLPPASPLPLCVPTVDSFATAVAASDSTAASATSTGRADISLGVFDRSEDSFLSRLEHRQRRPPQRGLDIFRRQLIAPDRTDFDTDGGGPQLRRWVMALVEGSGRVDGSAEGDLDIGDRDLHAREKPLPRGVGKHVVASE